MITTEELYQLFLKFPAISTDTRSLREGGIFFALSGDHFDGNRFAQEALAKGARYAVVDKKEFVSGDDVLLVSDTLTALQDLARLHRKRTSAKVLAITGSNGKTTTKELIASVLHTSRNIIATSGNLNNHIGVPLSVLSIAGDTEIAVIEMGANHVGEIAFLCGIAQPDTGIITNIGKAHLEGFGSYEGVIRAKSELYRHLEANGGNVLVNADDELLMRLSKGMNRLTYGMHQADLVGDLLSSRPVLKVGWRLDDEAYSCGSQLYGRYNFYNIMAAITCGVYFGVSPEQINQGIVSYIPENNRSQKITTATNTIYLDAYNANPVSMKEAISSFAEYAGEHAWVILGDMFELGHVAQEEHREIIRILGKTGLNNIILVGEEFYKLRKETGCPVFQSVEEAGHFLRDHPVRRADILLKGSRGMQLETLLNHL